MSKPDLTDEALAARIRTACEAQAAAVAVPDRPFEPGPPATHGLPTAPADRGPRRAVLAAAAVIVVGALAAGVVLFGADDGADQIRAGSTSAPAATTTVPASTAKDWLAPSSPPLGLDLTSVTWKAHRPLAGFVLRTQLFARSGGGDVLVIAQPGSGGSVGVPGPTIHGQPSTLSAPKEGDARLSWSDGRVSFDGEWRDMDQAAAVALLEGLRARSGDGMDGFDAPVGASVALVSEAEPDQLRSDVTLTYEGGGDKLIVQTSVSDAPTGEMVETAFSSTGPIRADGTATSFDSSSSYYTAVGLSRMVVVDGGDVGDGGASEPELAAVVSTLAPISEAGLQALQRTTPGADLASDPPSTSSPSSPTTTLVGREATAAVTQALGRPLARIDGSGGTTTIGAVADGRPTVVLLWAPWCVPCIQSLATFDRIAAAHPDGAVVAVAIDGTEDEIRRVLDGTKVSIPVLLDPGGAATGVFGGSSLPWEALIDPAGLTGGHGPAGGTEGPAIATNFLEGN